MRRENVVFLFQGDSITDCGRDSDVSLGHGYVKKIGDMLKSRYPNINAKIINRGVSGDRVKDLGRRWKSDCTDLDPDILTIMVGINDCARRYDSNDPTPADIFEEGYRSLIIRARETLPDVKIIVMEPFLLPLLREKNVWRMDLDPKINAVRRAAVDFKCGLIPLDGIFAQASVKGCENLTYDGVHLYDEGHGIIANSWINYYELWRQER